MSDTPQPPDPSVPVDPWTGVDNAISTGLRLQVPPYEIRQRVRVEIAAALATERQQHAEEVQRLKDDVQRIGKELMDALNEPMYAGSRDDWKWRAQAAEAQVASLTEERDKWKEMFETEREDATQWLREHDKELKRADALAEERDVWEHEARKLFWLHHGCSGSPYGDDGEMQCCGLDFKRWPWDVLRQRVFDMQVTRLQQAQEQEIQRKKP